MTDVIELSRPGTAEPTAIGREGAPAAGAAPRRRRRVPWGVWIGGAWVVLMVVLAMIGPYITPYSATSGDVAHRLQPMFSGGHILGTDGQGRDILSRLMAGARPSLVSGAVPVLAAGVLGTTLGMIAGLSGRLGNSVIMRVLDVFYAFPAVLLAIMINAALGSGISNAILALSIVLIPPIARVSNTEVTRLRNADFMESARSSGASRGAIALRQVIPNILPPITVYCTALVGLAIVFSAGLSFLGLGVAPPAPEWGAMLNDLRQNLYSQPALSLIPAFALFVTSLAFNVLGDGLRDLLDIRGTDVR